MTKRIPVYLKFLTKIFLITLVIYTLLRILLFILAKNNWSGSEEYSFAELLQAFLIGVRFDLVVLCYIFILPFTFLGIAAIFNFNSKVIFKISGVYLVALLVLSFLILCADIPYFLQYFNRLNTAAFASLGDGGYVFKMIIQEFTFLVYFILFLVLSLSFSYLFFKISRQTNFEIKTSNRIYQVLWFVMISGFLILGLRGRISEKSPIRTGTAYFCDNPLLNQLGLNPVFTLMSGYLKEQKENSKKVQLMDVEEAKKMFAEFNDLTLGDESSMNDLLTERDRLDSVLPNVVIVIMEGMSTFNLGDYGGPNNITPNLKKLISQSYYFKNIFSAGIHTYNGIYSTLYSYPALFKQQPLDILQLIPHDGLANILKSRNYKTVFYTNHDSQFDNVEGFLRANGFDEVVSEPDYPTNWHRNANGVPDHQMFEFGINKMNKEAKAGNPFLSVFMTTSNHKPYYLPKDIPFKPLTENEDEQMIAYSDWSIGNLMENASKQDWYQNTIFVFIGDHGVNLGHTYDMPLSYHHTPFIIFSSLFKNAPKEYECLGGQIDVAPTVLSLMNVSYQNNTMGVDLLMQKRPFMYFCADDKVGCIDKDYYLIIRDNGIQTLYRYKDLATKNYLEEFPEKADSMKNYIYSMMQITQWKIDQHLLKIK